MRTLLLLLPLLLLAALAPRALSSSPLADEEASLSYSSGNLDREQTCQVKPDGTTACTSAADAAAAADTGNVAEDNAEDVAKGNAEDVVKGNAEGTAYAEASPQDRHMWLHPPEWYLDSSGRRMSAPGYEKIVEIDFGTAQTVSGVDAEDTMAAVEKMITYMKDVVYKDVSYTAVSAECRVRHELCAFWAVLGECEANPAYMKLQCAPACQSCEQLSYEHRCPIDSAQQDIWQAGDLDRMFTRIVTDEAFRQYSPQILSGPRHDSNPGPWVVILDDFVTEDECDRLIELGAQKGYERSMDVGERKFDGTYDALVSKDRTSTNAWCIDECFNDTLTQSLLARQEMLTGVPDANNEHLQLLQYEVGQRYGEHHDYIHHHVSRAQGPRILTVFYYLNDVEAGGGTHFNKLGITVQPKRGRALLWPSVMDEHPNRKDYRTNHEALPVEGGVKYGANSWLHQRNFKDAHAKGCT